MTKTIKINFSDFWPGFEKSNNYFFRLLNSKYKLEISDNPDFLIYSAFGKAYKKHKGIRIYYTGENSRPDFKECDYAFTFDYIDNPNHYRLPLYALYLPNEDPDALVKKDENWAEIFTEKTKFCNFVVSNHHAQKRVEFFKRLSKYKKVDSGGKYLNNIGGRVKDKKMFINNYKFTISFENAAYPGYTTEKIVEPMLVNSIPIYWGNELVFKDFNPKSFLNYFDFNNEEDLIERIIQLDRNDDQYVEYLKEPHYNHNKVNEFIKIENILNQFNYIFDNDKTPIAQVEKNLSIFNFVK